MSDTSQLRSTADRVADKATSLIGSAAGTVVEPKHGAQQLGAAVKRPIVFLVVAAIVAGYVLGRRHGG
ncbi:MAG: hypothetical protein ACXV3F_11160 [Frankiaceae bacterium]